MIYETDPSYTRIDKFSKTIEKIRQTDKQRHFLNNLLHEISEIRANIKGNTIISNDIFLLPLIMLEGESSSLIESTRAILEDFSYDIEEINNIPQWETRNLINIYQKYFSHGYYFNNFLINANSICQIHLELYEYNIHSKFEMTYDPTREIERVRPGIILNNDAGPNFIGPSAIIDKASFIPLKPSLKQEFLEDLMETIVDKNKTQELLYDHIIISHPIFEAIQHFNDGNGRIGRFTLNLF